MIQLQPLILGVLRLDTTEFLDQVVTTPEGYFNLCLRSEAGVWHSEFFNWPNQRELIVDTALQASSAYDVYFTAYLYSERDAHKKFVLPSKTIQQDLDGADPHSLPITPTALVQTSPGRYQGYWVTTNLLDLELHELLSKRLAYSIPNCDRSGWSLGHKVRLPGTFNYKYLEGPHPVTVTQTSNRRYQIEELELLPDVDIITLERYDDAFVLNPPDSYPLSPLELVDSVKDHLSADVYGAYMHGSVANDRSVALWALTTSLFKAGLSKDQVYWVAKHSPNNKFDRLRYHAERELAKDVLRAETAVKTLAVDIREAINRIRKQTKILVTERKRAISSLVQVKMRDQGTFIKTRDSRRFYVQKSRGRPVPVSRLSESLNTILEIEYGLNRADTEHDFVVNAMAAYTDNLPETGQVATLSYYDPNSNVCLIHTGQKLVYQITATDITPVVNGAFDIIFPWASTLSPFVANLSNPHPNWGHEMFGNLSIANLEPHEAEALLKTWLMFVLLRNASRTRPLLALFGPPQSGKTTLSCKIYTFLYGSNLEVSGITEPEAFDIQSATLPLLVLDNLDTWERWLPDRLAQSARNTDVLVRKLYSDLDVVRVRRQAVIVVTAHDPKFGRADIVSRLLILNLKELIHQDPESEILDNILNNRNKLWGAIIHDIRSVLATPLQSTDLQLRVQDFATLGNWIATGLGCQQDFTNAILKLKGSQVSMNLTEDQALVAAITKWLDDYPTRHKGLVQPPPVPQDILFQELLHSALNERDFLYRYRNANNLGKRLANLQSSLDTIFSITQIPTKGGGRAWHITREDQL